MCKTQNAYIRASLVEIGGRGLLKVYRAPLSEGRRCAVAAAGLRDGAGR